MSSNDTQGLTIEQLGIQIANTVERWMPSPFLFAILLTYIVFFAALLLGELGIIEQAEGGTAGPLGLIEHWFDGFWDFLAFAMQMTVILMTGFALAYHPKANAILVRLAHIPSTPPQAVVLVAVFSMAIAWIHWGFSLILGAIFAREMGKVAHKKGIEVHYPLLAVSGYMGLGLTWHWGLSGSGPLLLTDSESVGDGTVFDMLPNEGIPITETIAHGYGITLTILSIIFASLVLYAITPSGRQARDITEYIPESELFSQETDGGKEQSKAKTPAERIDNSLILGGIIGITGFGYVFYMLITDGLGAWDLNVVNFGFLMAGLLIWTNPSAYREKFGEAATAAAGIILLFPFFAGIQGIMSGSGLATYIAEVLISASTAETFPVIAWLVAAITNAFIPSGGGQWLVLGPPLMEAAEGLGVEFGHAAMAYAVGDAHTNLVNPFWAIPLLAITRIKAREMFGYAIVMLIALTPFLAVMLYFLPYELLAVF